MNSIPKRRIGKTALKITELGFGGAAIGNLYEPVSNIRALDTVASAYENEVRYFDTAPFYGFGLSERRIGLALGEWPRDSYVLSTKVGRILQPTDPTKVVGGLFEQVPAATPKYDYSYDAVMRSVEDSLQRLGLHRIDILLIHDIDTVNHGTVAETERRYREVMEGGYRAMERMRSEGTIGAIGLGVNEWQWCERFAKTTDLDCYLLSGRYTLLDQGSLDSFLPLCESKGVSVIIGGPYNSGILAVGAVAGAHYDYGLASEATMDRVRHLSAVCTRYGIQLPSAALQFPLHHPCVASVIPGARSRNEVERNLELYRAAIPADFWHELKAEGLLREDAPIGTTRS